jgi:hypothetical protein
MSSQSIVHCLFLVVFSRHGRTPNGEKWKNLASLETKKELFLPPKIPFSHTFPIFQNYQHKHSHSTMDIDHAIPPTRKLVVHVFAGGFSSPQLSFFLNAINHLSPLISAHGQLKYISPPTVEYQHVQNMRLLRWTPNDLIDWLLASDIHFILTHPHQGVPRWDVSELHGALQRLRNHPGFPNGTTRGRGPGRARAPLRGGSRGIRW